MNITGEALSPSPKATADRWPEPMTAREWDNVLPGSLDTVAIMAGAANVILQLAHPGVGYGVVESRVESGQVFKHPVKRTRTTITYLAVALMGTTEEKLAYRKAVNRSHAQVHSTASSPVKYNAFDPSLQLWVAACLYWGYADTYRKLRREPSREEAEKFYKLAEPLGTTLQVRPDMWPENLDAFEAYWERGLKELHIDDTVRGYLTKLADLKFLHPAVSTLFGPFHRFVTAGFLPPEMRAEMRFDWGPDQQRRFDRLMAVVAVVNRSMPRAIRQLPFTLIMADFRRRLRKGLPLV